MSFKSRDLTVKLSGAGGGGCGGCTPTNPGCGTCTNTQPDCGQCSAPTRNPEPPNCTDTAPTTRCTEQYTEGAPGVGLTLLRQQLQEALGAPA